MLGERIPAAQALEWGLVNRVVRRRRLRRPRSTRWSSRLAAGPTASYAGTKRQLNAWLYARHGGAARARGRDPAGDGRLGGLPRGRPGLRREAPPRFRAGRRRPMALNLYPGPPVPRRSDVARRGLALLRRGRARRRLLVPETAARRTPTASARCTCSCFVIGAGRVRRGRGLADLLPRPVPGPQGPRGRPDPRQHAAGDRLDRRRGA